MGTGEEGGGGRDRGMMCFFWEEGVGAQHRNETNVYHRTLTHTVPFPLCYTQALEECFATPEGAKKMVSLKAFSKFDNTAEALAAAASMVDSKIGKDLKKFLKKHCEGETLALADAKLGGLIKEKMGIACVYSSGVMELMRGKGCTQQTTR